MKKIRDKTSSSSSLGGRLREIKRPLSSPQTAKMSK